MILMQWVVAALFLTSAQAQDWKHVTLQSTDRTVIQLDYQIHQETRPGCYKCTVPYYATPVWIHVEHPGLNRYSHVRLVLLNWRHFPWSWGAKELETQEFDISYAARGRFSFEMRQALRIHENGSGGTFKHTQELAVVIDGQWLTDPISYTHNFRLNLWDAAY